MTGVNIFGKKRLSSSFYCDGFDMTENTNNILLLFQLYRYRKGLMMQRRLRIRRLKLFK